MKVRLAKNMAGDFMPPVRSKRMPTLAGQRKKVTKQLKKNKLKEIDAHVFVTLLFAQAHTLLGPGTEPD